MVSEISSPHTAQPPPAADGVDHTGAVQPGDRELLDWWMLVMQGFHATQGSLVSELAERFNIGQVAADVLLRLLTAPQQRLPMTRLAREADMSSGGFTKLADRLCSAGMVQRVACEADRRVTYLELTSEGEDVAGAISRAAAEILRHRVLAPLGRDGLSKLAEAMRLLRDVGSERGIDRTYSTTARGK